jgi:hypothetical protein
MASRRSRRYKFVDAPPRTSMRKRSPQSAPRLFEWLVDNGYVEPVSSFRASRSKRRARRR